MRKIRKKKEKKPEVVLCKQYENIMDLPGNFSLRVKKIPVTGVFYLDLFEQGRGLIASQIVPDDRVSTMAICDMAEIVLGNETGVQSLGYHYSI